MTENVFDKKIAPCSCGSTNVFMRKVLSKRETRSYSLKCNHCLREQVNRFSGWDEAVNAWNEEVVFWLFADTEDIIDMC